MSTIAETRQEIADTLNAAFPEFDIKPYSESNNLTTGDGFVSFIGPVTSGDFGWEAVFAVSLVVATNPVEAAHKLDDLTTSVLNEITKTYILPASTSISAEPELLTAGDLPGAGVVYSLRVTLTMEVD